MLYKEHSRPHVVRGSEWNESFSRISAHETNAVSAGSRQFVSDAKS